MKIERNRMNFEEKIMFELHALYQKYGYSRYKMGKFEEYDLYVQNKDFIASESIIAFSDMNGKLMALKPDLTLSIVKNYRYEPGYVQKVFYSENVYRASKSAHTYQESLQTGLECMGDVGLYDTFEVTMLALRSLALVGNQYLLEISHMGLVADVLRDIPDGRIKNDVLRCIGEKNVHEMREICRAEGISTETVQNIELLIGTYGDYKSVIRRLKKLPLSETGVAALQQLSDVIGLLANYRMASRVNIDFSIVCDLTYYDGILFKGYVDGAPDAVLSGGQYTKLMSRMNKKGKALGFAVYMDYLDRISPGKKEYDVDVVFQYTLEDDLGLMYRIVRDLIHQGERVLVEKQIPSKIRYRKLIRLKGDEVVVVQQNDFPDGQPGEAE